MVKDLLPGLVYSNQVSSLLNQGARSGLSADYILDIRPICRLPDDPRLDQLIILDKLLLYNRGESGSQSNSLGPNLPDIPVQLYYTRTVVASSNREITLINYNSI